MILRFYSFVSKHILQDWYLEKNILQPKCVGESREWRALKFFLQPRLASYGIWLKVSEKKIPLPNPKVKQFLLCVPTKSYHIQIVFIFLSTTFLCLAMIIKKGVLYILTSKWVLCILFACYNMLFGVFLVSNTSVWVWTSIWE